MSLGFKLIIPCALALHFAAACTPDLNSLSAEYSASAGSPGADGGSGNSSNAGGPGAKDPCTDSKQAKNESDIDCGGTSECDRCINGASCAANSDCVSAYCKNKACTQPTCGDKIKNQAETGVDCGGPCGPCDVGIACSTNDDCSGGYCVDNKTCGDHCTSGVKEVGETGIDCGGTCESQPCDDGIGCVASTDCKSQICSNQKCQKATCTDGVLNQDESDLDCGGACAAANKACPTNAKCNREADCESWICSKAGKCLTDLVVVDANDIIDDFEDGNLVIPKLGTPPRIGNWYPFGDMSTGSAATLNIVAINRGASVTGLRMTGKGFTNWGSGVGTDMQSAKAPYDASAYSGVTFWARAESELPLIVVFPDADTDSGGKLCTTCDHHYNKTVQLGTGWQRFTVNFADLVQEPGTIPAPVAFKANGLISVQFRLSPNQTYDIYIDDLAFLKP